MEGGRKPALGVMSVRILLCATTAVSVFVNMSPKLAGLVRLLWADNDEWRFLLIDIVILISIWQLNSLTAGGLKALVKGHLLF